MESEGEMNQTEAVQSLGVLSVCLFCFSFVLFCFFPTFLRRCAICIWKYFISTVMWGKKRRCEQFPQLVFYQGAARENFVSFEEERMMVSWWEGTEPGQLSLRVKFCFPITKWAKIILEKTSNCHPREAGIVTEWSRICCNAELHTGEVQSTYAGPGSAIGVKMTAYSLISTALRSNLEHCAEL